MIGGIISGALSALGGILGGNETNKAAKRNDQLLSGFETNANTIIGDTYNQARGFLDQSLNNYLPLSGLATKAGTMYGDALGLNGSEGNARATGAFQAGPGYQFAMDQGLKALERRAASQGRLQSGQTGLDTINYATGMANQGWNSWLDRLANPGILAQGLQGASGTLSDLASLSVGTGDTKLNLQSELLNGRMGVSNQKAEGNQQMISGGLGGLSKAAGAFMGGYR